jgi:hypothetical protein
MSMMKTTQPKRKLNLSPTTIRMLAGSGVKPEQTFEASSNVSVVMTPAECPPQTNGCSADPPHRGDKPTPPRPPRPGDGDAR